MKNKRPKTLLAKEILFAAGQKKPFFKHGLAVSLNPKPERSEVLAVEIGRNSLTVSRTKTPFEVFRA